MIEDDYDSEYRYDINPIPPLHALGDSQDVVYLGTISKTLSPMLRIGYLVVLPQLKQVFATAKQLMDRHSPVAEQDALAALIESGAYERHIRRMRRLNGERRQTLLTMLRLTFADRVVIEGADAGPHVVVQFTDIARELEPSLIDDARKIGIGLHSTTPLYEPGMSEARPDRASLIMGYLALDTRQIERGIHLFSDAAARVRAGA